MSVGEWDDDRPLDDWEYPDGEDEESSDATPLRECANCGAEIYDDTVCCPICGNYDSREESSPAVPVWIKLAAAAAIIGMLTALRMCL
jgi:hypothetical protein